MVTAKECESTQQSLQQHPAQVLVRRHLPNLQTLVVGSRHGGGQGRKKPEGGTSPQIRNPRFWAGVYALCLFLAICFAAGVVSFGVACWSGKAEGNRTNFGRAVYAVTVAFVGPFVLKATVATFDHFYGHWQRQPWDAPSPADQLLDKRGRGEDAPRDGCPARCRR